MLLSGLMIGGAMDAAKSFAHVWPKKLTVSYSNHHVCWFCTTPIGSWGAKDLLETILFGQWLWRESLHVTCGVD